MDAIGTGGKRRPAELDIVVLADGEDRPGQGMRRCDGGQPIVCTRRQVDDDAIDLGQRHFERGERTHRPRVGSRASHEVRQPGRPDQIVGEDGHARGQSIVSAR